MTPTFILSNNTTPPKEVLDLSEYLNLPIVSFLPENCHDLYLSFEDGCLSLCKEDLKLNSDFQSMLPRCKPSNLNGELLIKAIHLKKDQKLPVVLDATAGFGEDSFLLAAIGCKVKLFEYNPIIAALLRNGLSRGNKDLALEPILTNMTFQEGNSIEYMVQTKERPDIIYLDPMFPGRQKSGLIKKKFQLLQLLEMPCNNEEELFQAAFTCKPQKIIVKRPANGPCIANRKPSYTISGNSIRYDCYYLGS